MLFRSEVTQRALLRNSLRMRPDRIIIGECRGPETLDMLQALQLVFQQLRATDGNRNCAHDVFFGKLKSTEAAVSSQPLCMTSIVEV